MTFSVYILQCADGFLYTGHTDNLEQRMAQHMAGDSGFTASRRPLRLLARHDFPTRDEALAAERQIKGWSRAKKLALASGDWSLITALARRGKVRDKLDAHFETG